MTVEESRNSYLPKPEKVYNNRTTKEIIRSWFLLCHYKSYNSKNTASLGIQWSREKKKRTLKKNCTGTMCPERSFFYIAFKTAVGTIVGYTRHVYRQVNDDARALNEINATMILFEVRLSLYTRGDIVREYVLVRMEYPLVFHARRLIDANLHPPPTICTPGCVHVRVYRKLRGTFSERAITGRRFQEVIALVRARATEKQYSHLARAPPPPFVGYLLSGSFPQMNFWNCLVRLDVVGFK